MLCATVQETTVTRAVATLRAAEPHADLIEVRIDALAGPDAAAVAEIVTAATVPIVVTCRTPLDRGRYAGSQADRFALLRAGIDAGAAWVDIESRVAEAFGDAAPARRIVSHHDFDGTPADLEAVLDGLLAYANRNIDSSRDPIRICDRAVGPDLAKLVPTARDPRDVLRLLRVLRGAGVPLVAHPMGPAGFPGRILAAALGSRIVYGAARKSAESAPGQPSMRSLVHDFRLDRDLTGVAPILLLGGRLDHSVSPAMHNRVYAEAGIPAIYVPWALDDPGPVLDAFREFGVRGAAVTIPHKEIVAMKMKEVEELVTRVGALNTIVVTPEGMRGRNTDVAAVVDSLAAAGDPAGRRALVVGAGGAGRAAVHGLAEAGASVTVVNRTRERARRLAAEVGGESRLLGHVDPETVDIVVNATSVGQWPESDATPLPEGFLRPRHAVLDMVYNPPETRLLAEAARVGCRATAGGMEMLARQAAAQIRAWFGKTVGVDVLRRAGDEGLARRRSVVLVGMRGAGKTTVGRRLAARLGVAFTDTDEEVEMASGRSISALFVEEGEAAFRDLEAEVVARALEPVRPAVIAIGGGAVETEAVRAAIRAGGLPVVWLDAPEEVLVARIAGSDRPALTGLSLREEVARLSARRRPRFEALADLVVDAGDDPDAVVAKLHLHLTRTA